MMTDVLHVGSLSVPISVIAQLCRWSVQDGICLFGALCELPQQAKPSEEVCGSRRFTVRTEKLVELGIIDSLKAEVDWIWDIR